MDIFWSDVPGTDHSIRNQFYFGCAWYLSAMRKLLAELEKISKKNAHLAGRKK